MQHVSDRQTDVAIICGTGIVGTTSVVAATSTSQTAAVLTFAGALIVAAITAITTNRRQKLQLEAEMARLDHQLGHDRLLTDVADLRSVIEEALSAVDNAKSAVGSSDSPPLPPQRAAIAAALEETAQSTNRLLVRLGPGDSLLESYNQLVLAVRCLMEQRLGREPSLDVDFTAAYMEFTSTSARRIGSVFPAERFDGLARAGL
jgi:hypothetical protein